MRRHSWAPKTSSLTRSPRRSSGSPTRGKGSARGCGRSRTTLPSRLRATSPPPSCTEPCLPGRWVYPGANPTESSQKKSCVEEPEPEPEAAEGDGDKKGLAAEGSSDEEGKLVIDEPTKEKNEKGALKRRAGDLLEDSPKRPKESEDPEEEEKEVAVVEGERPLPAEGEKNSTPSESSSGRAPPPEEAEGEEDEEAAKEDAEAPGVRDHESL
ncbi:hepatoma-derived growth factor isoform X1 [Pteropus vampyrus]|uniref:Hepatoma-derived growth factor isoform X1 n=1 Tax=Pteropus vampyrus TaxID=132908 RepID=A0A6P6CRV4_PTEVA|nr:hepatoma-derived growth factor isoform X1 [Pteropus vampyrus]